MGKDLSQIFEQKDVYVCLILSQPLHMVKPGVALKYSIRHKVYCIGDTILAVSLERLILIKMFFKQLTESNDILEGLDIGICYI